MPLALDARAAQRAAVPYRANWSNPGDYPVVGAARPVEWAWAFLRRNPKYCRAYAVLAYWRGIAASADVAASRKAERRAERRSRFIAKRFGLFYPRGEADPSSSSPPQFATGNVRFLDWNSGVPRTQQGHMSLRAPHEVLIAMDLRLPFEQEKARIEKWFRALKADKTRQKEITAIKGKARPEYYRRYLRVLDADSAEANSARIKRILYEGRKGDPAKRNALSNDRKAAAYLRDEGYIHIASTWWPKGKRGDT